MEQTTDPPYYILVSQSSNGPHGIPSTSTTFSHPTVEYHYADDSPQELLPRCPGEHVLVLDYNPDGDTAPTVHSLSSDLAVTGLKVSEAPGAGIAENGATKNDQMYVLETISMPEEIIEEDEYQTPHTILARFKQRNAILRQVLEYPHGQTEAPPQFIAEPPPTLNSPPSRA